jgi:hypothetical protein
LSVLLSQKASRKSKEAFRAFLNKISFMITMDHDVTEKISKVSMTSLTINPALAIIEKIDNVTTFLLVVLILRCSKQPKRSPTLTTAVLHVQMQMFKCKTAHCKNKTVDNGIAGRFF